MISGNYHQVIRIGISDNVKEMRFGRVLWSQNENQVKFIINLFDKIYDENNKFGGFLEPEFRNVKTKLIKTSKILDNLLTLLLEKELISDKEKESIEIVKEDEIDRLIFYRVPDLDEYLKETDNGEEIDP